MSTQVLEEYHVGLEPDEVRLLREAGFDSRVKRERWVVMVLDTAFDRMRYGDGE